MRSLFAAVVGAVVLTPALAAPVPKEIKKSAEQKLLGRWKLTKSDSHPNGISGYEFFVVFKEKGVLELRYEYAGDRPPTLYTGRYKVVDDDKIDYTVGRGNTETGEVLVIEKLTADEVKWVDPDNKREELVRARKK